MSFCLRVDGQQWRDHLARTIAQDSSIVPVIKGNGYGFGNDQLAREASALPVSTIAVGTHSEVPRVREHFAREVLVLSPWHPTLSAA
ncbi:MAG: alanine racemase, partial [Actinomycetes bacterium]